MNLKYENARWLIITLASLAFLALVIHLTCCTTKKRSLEYRLKSLHIETDTTKTHKVSTNDFEGHTNKTKPDSIDTGYINDPTTTPSLTFREKKPVDTPISLTEEMIRKIYGESDIHFIAGPITLSGKGITYPVLPIPDSLTGMHYKDFNRLVLISKTSLIYNDSTGIIIDTTK